VDWMLESGYDLNGDPRLSELFHRVVDTCMRTSCSLPSGRRLQRSSAVPAAIDEVAEMTFSGRSAAEGSGRGSG